MVWPHRYTVLCLLLAYLTYILLYMMPHMTAGLL